MFKLSLLNIKRSAKNYIMYLITIAFEIAFLITILACLQDKQLYDPMLHDIEIFIGLFRLSQAAVILVIIWLIRYMGKYILNLRSKEFATYMLLGVENKNINRLYGIEQFILGLIALPLGLLFGGALYAILPKIVLSLLELEYTPKLLPPDAIIKTCLWVFGIHIFFIFFGSLRLKKKKIIDLLQIAKENEKIRAKKFSVPLFFIFLIITVFVYIQLFYIVKNNTIENNNIKKYFVQYFFIMAAAIFGMSYFLPSVFLKLKTAGDKTYRLKTLSIKFASSRISELAIKFFFISLVSIIALIAFNLNVMTMRFYTELRAAGGSFKSADLIFWYYQDSGDSVDNSDFDSGLVAALKSVAIKGDARVAWYVDNNTGELINVVYRNEGDPLCNWQDVFPLSSYNAVRKMHGLSPCTLQRDELILHIDSLDRSKASDIKKDSYPVFDKKYYLKSVFVENFFGGGAYIVLADEEIPPTLIPRIWVHYWDFENPSDEILKPLLLEYAKNAGFRPIKVKLTDDTFAEKLPYQLELKSDDIKRNQMVASSLTQTAFSAGIILLLITGAIISTSVITDLQMNRRRYDILKRLGMSSKDLLRLLKRQLAFFFLLPIILALPVGLGISILIIEENYIGNYYQFMFQILTPQIIIFFAVYAFYYIATVSLYKRFVRE